jgi:hypothetical protein
MQPFRHNRVLRCPICKTLDQHRMSLHSDTEVKGDGEFTLCIFTCTCGTNISTHTISPREFELALAWDGKQDYKTTII